MQVISERTHTFTNAKDEGYSFDDDSGHHTVIGFRGNDLYTFCPDGDSPELLFVWTWEYYWTPDNLFVIHNGARLAYTVCDFIFSDMWVPASGSRTNVKRFGKLEDARDFR